MPWKLHLEYSNFLLTFPIVFTWIFFVHLTSEVVSYEDSQFQLPTLKALNSPTKQFRNFVGQGCDNCSFWHGFQLYFVMFDKKVISKVSHTHIHTNSSSKSSISFRVGLTKENIVVTLNYYHYLCNVFHVVRSRREANRYGSK